MLGTLLWFTICLIINLKVYNSLIVNVIRVPSIDHARNLGVYTSRIAAGVPGVHSGMIAVYRGAFSILPLSSQALAISLYHIMSVTPLGVSSTHSL